MRVRDFAVVRTTLETGEEKVLSLSFACVLEYAVLINMNQR